MNRPKKIYYASLNLMGLYSRKPIQLKLKDFGPPDEDGTDDSYYYDKSGNICEDVDKIKIGESTKDDEKFPKVIKFTHTDKEEVQKWINGAIAAMQMMKAWCNV